jgi:hypothetical protein
VAEPAALPSLEEIAHQAARQFGQVFGEQVLAVESPAELRRQASAGIEQPAEPVEDTPLSIPAEVERLHGIVDKPVRA